MNDLGDCHFGSGVWVAPFQSDNFLWLGMLPSQRLSSNPVHVSDVKLEEGVERVHRGPAHGQVRVKKVTKTSGYSLEFLKKNAICILPHFLIVCDILVQGYRLPCR